MKTVKILWLVAVTLIMADFAFAQTWTPTSFTNMTWVCFASSADGNTLVAEPVNNNDTNNAVIFISTNGGVTWITNTLPSIYVSGLGQLGVILQSVASSADGTKLAGASTGVNLYGYLCTSTNSGTTWTTNNNAPSVGWDCIASSADGLKLVAGIGGAGVEQGGAGQWAGPIYVSTNSGVTWFPTMSPSNSWNSIASSADGTILFASTYSGLLYFSTDSGNTWAQANVPARFWKVASSADGKKLVAEYTADTNTIPGHILTSTDSGNTWVSNTFVSSYFESVAVSGDGNTIVATGNDPVVFVSTNFGGSWETNSLPGGGSYFDSVAISADGGKAITGSSSSSLLSPDELGLSYISQTVYAPQLNISPASTNLALSWTIPSTNFMLQQSSDLISWVDLTNMPILNLTNLQNQVSLSPTNGIGFFRLSTP
jgi:hypothetical protein